MAAVNAVAVGTATGLAVAAVALLKLMQLPLLFLLLLLMTQVKLLLLELYRSCGSCCFADAATAVVAAAVAPANGVSKAQSSLLRFSRF